MMRLLCAFALVTIGFAHRPLSTEPVETRSSAYQLPDGTYASLCIGDHGAGSHTPQDGGCDACRLAGGVIVPAPPCILDIVIALSCETRVCERHYNLAKSLYPPNSGPRAPPLS